MARLRVAVVACACLLLAACGGTTTKQASIRRSTAISLAGQSEAVAAALQRGDSCAAASKAKALRLRVASAIASGSIPQSLAVSARSAASRLADRIELQEDFDHRWREMQEGFDQRWRVIQGGIEATQRQIDSLSRVVMHHVTDPTAHQG